MHTPSQCDKQLAWVMFLSENPTTSGIAYVVALQEEGEGEFGSKQRPSPV